jgi:NO-binding membrane sensor protein with MHYT domain
LQSAGHTDKCSNHAMYENRRRRLLTPAQFARRVLGHVTFAIGVIAAALYVGMAGYHYLAKLDWIDSLLNASMILGGMGPVDPLKTDGAKVFASFYALFSGLVFIGVLGVLLAPFVHRLMHKVHMDEEGS